MYNPDENIAKLKQGIHDKVMETIQNAPMISYEDGCVPNVVSQGVMRDVARQHPEIFGVVE